MNNKCYVYVHQFIQYIQCTECNVWSWEFPSRMRRQDLAHVNINNNAYHHKHNKKYNTNNNNNAYLVFLDLIRLQIHRLCCVYFSSCLCLFFCGDFCYMNTILYHAIINNVWCASIYSRKLSECQSIQCTVCSLLLSRNTMQCNMIRFNDNILQQCNTTQHWSLLNTILTYELYIYI